MKARTTIAALLILAAACQHTPAPSDTTSGAESAPRPETPTWDRVDREAFNAWSMKLNLPFFWKRSADGATDPKLEPDELAVVLFYGKEPRSHWVQDGAFTTAFAEAYDRIAKAAEEGAAEELPESEQARIELLHREIDQGRPTLVSWDFTKDETDQALMEEMLAVARLIEELFAEQKGTTKALEKMASLDPASQAVLVRNQEPFCVAPATESDARCTALPGSNRIYGLYPASIQENPTFCDELARHPRADDLLAPFTVVRERDGELIAVPYASAYRDRMSRVATHLRAAADLLDPEAEGPFIAYLRAAAGAFETNDWFSADEAWAAMNAQNSEWYLRVGPDEVYYDPCNRKAGFHMSFARINPDSLEWQNRLEPVKQQMEDQLAKMAKGPYRARQVSFHLPDFIDIVLNAGNSRSPHGATIGQSLPNWGPVANEGRGRTVAMTNLYTDPDSRRVLEEQAASLFCPASMDVFTADPEPFVMSIVLHEAAHNLGPSHEYEVRGKTDDEIFGGPLASTMEELKAQSSALYLSDWLAERGIITTEDRHEAHMRDLAWAFGHISRGMYDAAGRARSYSQLSAIQLGYLMDEGAVAWNPEQTAANGRDLGCFSVDLDRMSDAVFSLESLVLTIKGSGAVKKAEKLKADYVDAEARADMFGTIQERWLRAPKATFLYGIRY